MNPYDIALGLIKNLLVGTLSIVFINLIRASFWKRNKSIYQWVFGVLFAMAAFVGLNFPVNYSPGIIRDFRNVLVGLASFYGGLPAGIIAAGIAGGYRLYLGGGGAFGGIMGLFTAAIIGYLVNRFASKKNFSRSYQILPVLGFCIFTITFLWSWTLPKEQVIKAIQVFVLPEILLYPLVTILYGTLFELETDRQVSMEHFRAVFHDSPIGIAILSFEGERILDANPSLCRILGYSKSELLGKPLDQIIYRAIEGSSRELEFVKKTGDPIWLTVSTTKIHSQDSKTGYGIVLLEDVTKRKKAEKALEDANLRQNEAVKAGNVGLWDWDLITNKVFYSPEWKRQVGYADHEIGDNFEEWKKRVHPDDLERIFKTVNESIDKTLNYHEAEFRIKHKDGSYRWILMHASIIQDENGKPVRMLGSHIDITEQKKLETDILRSQKMESIGTLAGGIAHDFNNILTAILGNITLAKDLEDSKSERYELLNEAEKASMRAQSLTKQLLTFAKGGMPVKEIADIGSIVKESCQFITRGSKSRCEFSIADDLWAGKVDTGQFDQVINNIVINANQAMPEGGIIYINAENILVNRDNKLKLGPGRYIRVSIKDDGIGIPEKYLLKIFDPYFSTKQEGSGLGLATSYSIINKHGGIITVESEIGKGTTFHIYIPASEKPILHKETDSFIKGEGRILVMDDEESIRAVLKRMLEKLEYETEFAKDGAEAIEIYKSAMKSGTPFDAVILDLTIPGGMGGKDTIEKLLELDPGVKAIVSSGYSDNPVLANYRDYGFKGVVPKPFEAKSLSKELHKVLKAQN